MNEEPLWPDDYMKNDVFLGTVDGVDIYYEQAVGGISSWFWFNFEARGRVCFGGMRGDEDPFKEEVQGWATPAVQQFISSYQQLIR